MKILSLWNPWAEAMRRGLKKNETRSWETMYRGPLAIHSALKPFRTADYDHKFVQRVRDEGIDPATIIYGAVLCIVDLVDCVPTESLLATLTPQEELWGDYTPGRHAWVTENLRVLPEPIPLIGRQGLFNWPQGDVLLPQLEVINAGKP